ncbi:MAG: DbpA RNA binding domain-containing protein, partial [Opitutaceae bacterium]
DQGYASTDISSALIHLLQAGGGAGAAPAPAKAAVKPKAETRQHEDEHVPVIAKEAETPRPAAWGQTAPPLEKPEFRASKKPKYERPARTGREAGMATLFFNVGRKELVTPADIVGKIAGVTGLPADVVGAIDIHQRHTLVDVAKGKAGVIVEKLGGIRLKGVSLAPMQAENETTG